MTSIPMTDEHLRALISKTIREQSHRPDSVLSKSREPKSLVYRPVRGKSNNFKAPTGSWFDPVTNSPAVIPIVGELSQSLNYYMDINPREGEIITEARLLNSKWKPTIRFESQLDLPDDVADLYQNQFLFLWKLQNQHEGKPSLEDIEFGLDHPKRKGVESISFVRTKKNEEDRMDIVLATDYCWRQDTLDRSTQEKNLFQPRSERKKLSRNELSTEVQAKEGTLASWNDPDSHFTGEVWTTAFKNRFHPNKDVLGYDENRKLLTAFEYVDVFQERVWIEADVMLNLWDIPATANKRATRIYQVLLLQMRALHGSSFLHNPSSLKRTASDEMDDDLEQYRPPTFRRFDEIETNLPSSSQESAPPDDTADSSLSSLSGSHEQSASDNDFEVVPHVAKGTLSSSSASSRVASASEIDRRSTRRSAAAITTTPKVSDMEVD